MTALLRLLAVAGFPNHDETQKMLGGSGHGGPATAGAPGGQGGITGQVGLGGLLGNLGVALEGVSADGLLCGGLGRLVDGFRENDHGEAAESWVNHGPNDEMKPDHLSSTIGPNVLDTLSRQTGQSHDDLLSWPSRELPCAVDRLCPRRQATVLGRRHAGLTNHAVDPAGIEAAEPTGHTFATGHVHPRHGRD